MENLVSKLKVSEAIEPRSIQAMNLKSIVDELKDLGILKKNNCGKWQFVDKNLPENYRKVHNGKRKIVEGIEKLIKKYGIPEKVYIDCCK